MYLVRLRHYERILTVPGYITLVCVAYIWRLLQVSHFPSHQVDIIITLVN